MSSDAIALLMGLLVGGLGVFAVAAITLAATYALLGGRQQPSRTHQPPRVANCVIQISPLDCIDTQPRRRINAADIYIPSDDELWLDDAPAYPVPVRVVR